MGAVPRRQLLLKKFNHDPLRHREWLAGWLLWDYSNSGQERTQHAVGDGAGGAAVHNGAHVQGPDSQNVLYLHLLGCQIDKRHGSAPSMLQEMVPEARQYATVRTTPSLAREKLISKVQSRKPRQERAQHAVGDGAGGAAVGYCAHSHV